MKIYKLIITLCLMASGYVGWQNFGIVEPYIDPVIEMIEHDSVKSKVYEMKEPERDWVDIGMKVGEMVLPLIPAYIARRRRKTLDDEIADVAEKMGVSPKTVRGKLGLGDRRKKQSTTNNTRRKKD
jgi:hypothetical protein